MIATERSSLQAVRSGHSDLCFDATFVVYFLSRLSLHIYSRVHTGDVIVETSGWLVSLPACGKFVVHCLTQRVTRSEVAPS